jgi:hypothetical protein
MMCGGMETGDGGGRQCALSTERLGYRNNSASVKILGTRIDPNGLCKSIALVHRKKDDNHLNGVRRLDRRTSRCCRQTNVQVRWRHYAENMRSWLPLAYNAVVVNVGIGEGVRTKFRTHHLARHRRVLSSALHAF